jgi:SARP family transcriptional regulator, regulator of embCAB operon
MQIISRKTEKMKDARKIVEKIEVRTFGGLSILYNDLPVAIDWESQKARLLFCCLMVTYDQWVHRQKLLEAIWPGCNILAGEKNFKTTLSRLRKSFSGAQCLNPVLTQGEALRINFDAVSLDASRFKSNAAQGIKLLVRGEIKAARKLLESAQDIYSGDFLPEEPFNQFITLERRELADIYSAVLRALEKSYELEGNRDAIEVFSFLKNAPLGEIT